MILLSRRALFVPLALALCTPAGAAPNRSARRCEKAIATAGEKVLTKTLASLAACDARVARGVLPATSDCAAETATDRAANGRLVAPVRAACRTAPPVVRGGDCVGVTGADDLAACIQGSHDAAAVAASDALGPAPGTLTGTARACRKAAVRALRQFGVARLRAIQRCKRRPPDTLQPGDGCSGDVSVVSRLQKPADQTLAALTRRCPADAIAAAGFPAACRESVGVLAQCVLDAARAATDAAVAAEFPAAGFCGDAGAAVERRVDELLAQMTLEEKLSQLHGVTFPGRASTAVIERLGVPGLVMVDGPRGVGIVGGQATPFPVGIARGATWDADLETRVGAAMGTEARAKEITVLLAPTINMVRHPRWGRTQESYGEDTFHLGTMGAAFVRGVQQQRVIANPKHFAVNSVEDTRLSVDVTVDERTLREIYLPHFRRAVQEGHAASVMSAYNKVNGHYCAENSHLLHDVLKGDWGFQGFVESDWLAGTRSTVPSMQAGLDIEMPTAVWYGQRLADALGAGEVTQERIDGAVRRSLRVQLCFRLDTDSPVADSTRVETPAHRALAREVARKGIVLLKNAGPVLPLDRTAVPTIAVVGAPLPTPTGQDPAATTPLDRFANLGDFGSSTVVPTSPPVTPLDAITAAAGGAVVTHVAPCLVGTAGCTTPLTPGDESTITGAHTVIVVAGLFYGDEGEGNIAAGDRESLGLPRNQDALIAAVAALNPRTIVVLEGSGPVLMPWLEDVRAVVDAWYPGVEGGPAVAEVLFGDVNPSGKLPLSFPRAGDDLPPFDSASQAIVYDYWHGYRHLDRNGATPLFPFGYGLSYTSFSFANLTVRPTTLAAHGHLRVTADVTNTGTRAGDEVAQLYVGAVGSVVDRAVNELKAFARVHLEPGETRTVTFDVPARDLAYWNVAASRWEVEAIAYRVRVGSSSRDLPLEDSFTVAP